MPATFCSLLIAPLCVERVAVRPTPADTIRLEVGSKEIDLLATWYLTRSSPYMVSGEVPLPDGRIQRMTEVAIPSP
jgi:hypothetical protein